MIVNMIVGFLVATLMGMGIGGGGLIGSIGSVIFSRLAVYVNSEIPRKMLGGLLIIGGAISIYNNLFRKSEEE